MCAIFFITVLGVLIYSLVATPQYAASTRLFVSTASENDGTKINDGRVFAERRVVAYVDLLEGEVLAQRTIARLNLNMTPAQLQNAVSATAPVGTVLIDVTVTNPSPTQARDIVNTLSDEFALMAANLEMPPKGNRPNAQVVVLERADTPEHPLTPKKSRNLVIAAALGTLMGVIVAVARDRLDHTVRTIADVEEATNTGAIGEIPFHPGFRQQLITFAGNYAPAAEAFRELRTNLQRLEISDGPRVVVVASARHGEGRTVTALNLALAIAAANRTVVVVDANFRHPGVASRLGIEEQVGLSSMLARDADLSRALQRTRFPRVTALTAGALEDPPESISVNAIGEILDELAREFDYVIVDSPPAISGDAAVLASVAQGVLLVARFGKTPRIELASAAVALRLAGALLLGVVLSQTPASKWNSIDKSYHGASDHSRPEGGRARRRVQEK